MIEARNFIAADRLKDGTPVTVRAIRSDDRERLHTAFKSLDRQSVYTRFFSYKKELSDTELTQLTDVDADHVVALVVTIEGGDGEQLIGGGRYCSEQKLRDAESVELAFMTADDYHGRGIASLLLKHLFQIAHQQGVRRFEADVLAGNQAMLAVFRRSGMAMSQRLENNTVHVTLSMQADP